MEDSEDAVPALGKILDGGSDGTLYTDVGGSGTDSMGSEFPCSWRPSRT